MKSIKKYIQVHEWTDRVEIALPAKGWRDSFEKAWEISDTKKTSSGSTHHPLDALALPLAPIIEDKTEEAEPHNRKRAKTGGDNAKQAGQNIKRQATEKMMKDIHILKGQMTKTLTTANTLLRCIDEEPAWAWRNAWRSRT